LRLIGRKEFIHEILMLFIYKLYDPNKSLSFGGGDTDHFVG
jgi:hypothetical protein